MMMVLVYHIYIVVANFYYQFDTIYDYSKISGLDGMLINYGTIGPYLKKDDAQVFAERFHELPCVFLTEKVDMANCYFNGWRWQTVIRLFRIITMECTAWWNI